MIDLPKIETTVFLANKSVHAIRADGGLLGSYGLRRLATSRGRSARRSFFYLENFGELLHYGRGGLFDGTYRSQRLTERGLEDIEGGAIGTLSFDRQENGWLVRTPTLGGAVLGGDDALYFYDGAAVRPLAGGELTRIGKSPVINRSPGSAGCSFLQAAASSRFRQRNLSRRWSCRFRRRAFRPFVSPIGPRPTPPSPRLPTASSWSTKI